MGMTDLQFKSHLRHVIDSLKRAEEADSYEKAMAEIKRLKELLEQDLRS